MRRAAVQIGVVLVTAMTAAARLRGTTLTVGKPVNLGIVFEGPDAVGTAMAIPLGQQGDSFTRLGVTAMTLVNGIPVSVNLYDDYAGQATVGALVEETKAVARDLVKANP